MIESSGQILTARAAADMPAVIEVRKRADGFYESFYKLLAMPSTMPTEDSGLKGTWAVIANEGDDERFLGIAGSDTAPEANVEIPVVLNDAQPVLNLYKSHNVPKGGVIPFERNGIIVVCADEEVKEGQLLVCADDGKVKPAASTKKTYECIGRAYENAAEGETFRAFIRAL